MNALINTCRKYFHFPSSSLENDLHLFLKTYKSAANKVSASSLHYFQWKVIIQLNSSHMAADGYCRNICLRCKISVQSKLFHWLLFCVFTGVLGCFVPEICWRCSEIHCCLNLVSWSTALVQTKISQQLLHGLTFSADIFLQQNQHIDIYSLQRNVRNTNMDGLPWNLLLQKFCWLTTLLNNLTFHVLKLGNWVFLALPIGFCLSSPS